MSRCVFAIGGSYSNAKTLLARFSAA